VGDRDGDRGRSVSSPPPPLAINWQSTGQADGNQRHRVAINGTEWQSRGTLMAINGTEWQSRGTSTRHPRATAYRLRSS
jgi:hypothetical protein